MERWLRSSRILSPVRVVVGYLYTKLACLPSERVERCYMHGRDAIRTVGVSGHICAICEGERHG